MNSRIDLRIDFAFKTLFGSHGNESILAAFLNAALRRPDNNPITEVAILDPHLNKESIEDKKSILDVHAKLSDGTRINIEIQLSNKHDMEKRTLYYWSKMFTGQMKERMDYSELNKTITINILNFRYLHQLKDFHSTFHLYDSKHQYRLTDTMEIHFIELPKFLVAWRNEEVNPWEDRLVRWLLLLEASEDERITETLEGIAMHEDKDLKKAIDEWERVSQDESVRLAYEARRKAVLDEQSALKRAERLGVEKGVDVGKIEVARNLIKLGLDDHTIAQATGFDLRKIQELRRQ